MILREIYSQSFYIPFNEVYVFFTHVVLSLFLLVLPQISIEIVRLSLFSGSMKLHLLLFRRVDAKIFGILGLHFCGFYDKIHHLRLIRAPRLDLFLWKPQLGRSFCVIHHFFYLLLRKA